MKNLGKLMKQAQEMQSKMAQIQEELANEEFEVSSGGGMVTAEITPWLQAGIGLKILPSGQVEVSGTVEFPAAVQLFPPLILTKIPMR